MAATIDDQGFGICGGCGAHIPMLPPDPPEQAPLQLAHSNCRAAKHSQDPGADGQFVTTIDQHEVVAFYKSQGKQYPPEQHSLDAQRAAAGQQAPAQPAAAAPSA